MNNNGSIRDKGNAWKLVYAAFVAVENAPQDNSYGWEDENGNMQWEGDYFTPNDLKSGIEGKKLEEISFGDIALSDAIHLFINKYEDGQATFPFTYEAFLKNEDIIDTIEGFGLNVEQFWYAILFVYWLTQVKCVNVFKPKGRTCEQMRELKDYLQGVGRFTIVVDGKKKLLINDGALIDDIYDLLSRKISEYPEHHTSSSRNGFASDYLHSSSIQMWFSTTRYLKLFENLELPTIRAIGSEVKYKDKWTKQDNPTSGGNKTVSYNKMLLISRLMYFTRLTRNENFLSSDESLKGIIKQYKDFRFNTYNSQYAFSVFRE